MAQTKKRKPSVNSKVEKKIQIQPAIIKQIHRLWGYDDKLYDSFTKKQKFIFSAFTYYRPKFKIKEKCIVPRQYLKYIREKSYQYMNSNYLGDELNNPTFMEFMTFGIAVKALTEYILHPTNLEIDSVKDLEEILRENFRDFWHYLKKQTATFSKVNFRTYTFAVNIEKKEKLTGQTWVIIISSKESIKKRFVYNKIPRAVYPCFTGGGYENYSPAVISLKKIYPDNTGPDKKFAIFIQSHAIQRVKERLDAIPAMSRNWLIMSSITFNVNIVKSDNNTLLCCNLEGNIPVGYFAFTIQDDDLYILTFLPLVSKNTPEGKKLFELLKLSKDELNYLGMDKLSFYLTIDIEQIPVLKKALIKSGIWKMRELLLEFMDELNQDLVGMDMKKTQFVKSFFEKRTQQMKSS